MLIGAHESIAGGFEKSIQRAVQDECEAVQIFTGPPGRWTIPQVDQEVARVFKKTRLAHGAMPVVVHGIYLINPAGPDPDMWIRSLVALREEYERCQSLEIDQLVIHPGSHRKTSVEEGIRRAAQMIRSVLDDYPSGPVILLENTAGSGSSIGSSFNQLAEIRGLTGYEDRVYYCLDTAHAYAAGYDLRNRGKVAAALARIDEEAGLENIRCIHLNDTRKELGSGIDRHERIGEGNIGAKGFEAIMNQNVFRGLPGILETQPLPDNEGRYRSQVRFLRKLSERST